MLTFTFRIRFVRSPFDTLDIDAPEWQLRVDDHDNALVLRDQHDQSIRNATKWVLTGEGYPSEESARAAGKLFQDALMLAFVRVQVGADFGERSGKSVTTEYGLAWYGKETGRRTLNDVHGLMVFAAEPKPQFVLTTVTPLRVTRPEPFEQALRSAVSLRPVLDDREKLSIELFNASFFQPSQDSRFLLLMMAVEALCTPAPRSDPSRSHVDELLGQTSSSSLPDDEKASLIGGLRTLLYESIGRTGRRLAVERLAGTKYQDKNAPDFFNYCYGLRSSLVHGAVPFPSFGEVSATAAHLQIFVSDLLTRGTLGEAT